MKTNIMLVFAMIFQHHYNVILILKQWPLEKSAINARFYQDRILLQMLILLLIMKMIMMALKFHIVDLKNVQMTNIMTLPFTLLVMKMLTL